MAKKKKNAGKNSPTAYEQNPQDVLRKNGRVPPIDAFDRVPRRMPPPIVRLQMQDKAGARKMQQEQPKKQKQAQKSQKKHAQKNAKQRKTQEVQQVRKAKNARKKPNPARRRFRQRLIVVLAGIVLIVAGVWLSMNGLFKIKNYTLQGISPYSEAEIAGAFGQAIDSSMFGFSVQNAKTRIEKELPYIEKITIRRRLPGTIVFKVQMASEKYLVPWEGRYAVLSTEKKVLRFAEEDPGGLIHVNGLSDISLILGRNLALVTPKMLQLVPPDGEILTESGATAESTLPKSITQDEKTRIESDALEAAKELSQARVEALDLIIDAVAQAGLENVLSVDVTNRLDMQLNWNGRVTIKLGSRADMLEKLKFATVLLTSEDPRQRGVADDENGILDVGAYPAKMDRVWFTPS